MNKPRSDSIWAGLSTEQRETLEGWLFEENLSYREVVERAQKEFCVTASTSSLGRYYGQLSQERRLQSMEEAKSWVAKLAPCEPGKENLEEATVKLLGLSAYELALAGPEKLKLNQLAWLMKTLMQNRRLRVREQHLELAQQQFNIDGLLTAIRLRREHADRPGKMSYEEMQTALAFVKKEFYGEEPKKR